MVFLDNVFMEGKMIKWYEPEIYNNLQDLGLRCVSLGERNVHHRSSVVSMHQYHLWLLYLACPTTCEQFQRRLVFVYNSNVRLDICCIEPDVTLNFEVEYITNCHLMGLCAKLNQNLSRYFKGVVQTNILFQKNNNLIFCPLQGVYAKLNRNP